MNDEHRITDDAWLMIMAQEKRITDFFIRVSALPRDIIRDCVADAVIDVVGIYNPVVVANEFRLRGISPENQVFEMLKGAANSRLRRARAYSAKTVSEETPLAVIDDDELKFRDLFVGRSNSAERVENYADWMGLAKKRRGPFTPEEIDDLFGFSIEREI